MLSSRTRPPVGEEGEEVGYADVAVPVEIGGMPRVGPPCPQQDEQILHANVTGAVKIPHAFAFVGDTVAVGVHAGAGRYVAGVGHTVVVAIRIDRTGRDDSVDPALPLADIELTERVFAE